MKTGTSIYLSDKDKKRIDFLLNVYETEKVSELIRILIEKEYQTVKSYQDLNIK